MKKFLTFLFAVMLVLTCCALIGCDEEEDNTQTSTEPEKTAVSLELSGSLTEDGNVLKDSAFPDDITLKIVYSDNTKGEEVAVTAEMVSGFDTSIEGRKTATVSYEELEADIPYRVYSNEMQLNFYLGAGTEVSPYEITTAEELQNVSLSLSSYFGRAYSGGLGGLKVMTTLSENSVSNNTYTAESYATGDYILFTGEQWG